MRAAAAVFGVVMVVFGACTPKQVSWPDTTLSGVEDAFVTADDFSCLSGWDRVGRTYIRNVRGHQEEALAAARDGGAYPVGTIVQLFPEEAMVKRGEGFSPETKDWEFLILANAGGETIITDRGTTGLRNIAGSCAECHLEAEARYDMVCMSGHGCEPFPNFVLKMAERSLRKDSRCP